MDPRDRLLRQYDRFENERKTLLEQLERHGAAELSQAQGPGAWSVAQIIMHLVMVERSSLAYLLRKRELGGSSDAWSLSGLRLALLNMTPGLPLRFKPPPVVADDPECTLAEAVAAWGAVRVELQRALTALPPAILHHGLFKHPIAGRFTPEEGLRFMAAHQRHHRGQIDRTLARIGARSAARTLV